MLSPIVGHVADNRDSIAVELNAALAALGPSSSLFLARIPSRSAAGRFAAQASGALHASLFEPCSIQVAHVDAQTVLVGISPLSGDAPDVLEAHQAHAKLQSLASECLASVPHIDGSIASVLAFGALRPADELGRNVSALNELLETIVGGRLRVQFQPIVDLNAGEVFAYEALARMPQEGVLKRTGNFFQVADRARMVAWLDVACLRQCMLGAQQANVRKHLFLNMDAEGLAYQHNAEQSLAEMASEYGISPSQVVLEITERQTLDDFPRLVSFIADLRSAGFKIAVDDAGSGYSSLRAIAELRPDFVKIERALVRGLHENGARRALVRSLSILSRDLGAGLIVEGIETRDELAAVMELGAAYAQGYLLAKPNDNFKGLRTTMVNELADLRGRRVRLIKGTRLTLGDIARRGVTVEAGAGVEEVHRQFKRNSDAEWIAVLEDGAFLGALARSHAASLALRSDDDAPTRISVEAFAPTLTASAATTLMAGARTLAHLANSQTLGPIFVLAGHQYAGIVTTQRMIEALAGAQPQENEPPDRN